MHLFQDLTLLSAGRYQPLWDQQDEHVCQVSVGAGCEMLLVELGDVVGGIECWEIWHGAPGQGSMAALFDGQGMKHLWRLFATTHRQARMPSQSGCCDGVFD